MDSKNKKGMRAIVLAAILVISIFAFVMPAMGHSGDVIYSSWATTPPTIDGTIGAGEWSNANTYTLNYSIGMYIATVYVMNDVENLYIAVEYPDTIQDANDTIAFAFDTEHDGVLTDGDEDGFLLGFIGILPMLDISPGPGDYLDGYYSSTSGLPLPVLNDSIQDGEGARTYVGVNWTIEISKPLNSGDPQDMSVNPGDTVGVGSMIADYPSPMFPFPSGAGAWPQGMDPFDCTAPDFADLKLAVPTPKVPQFNPIGLLALVGILMVFLAGWSVVRRK